MNRNTYRKLGGRYADENNRTNLGKRDWRWFLTLVFCTPFWVLWDGNKVKWSEFESRCITHKCEYDFDNPVYDRPDMHNKGKHYVCKHYGCNIIEVRNQDGTWC